MHIHLRHVIYICKNMFHVQVHIKVVHIEGILNSILKILTMYMARFEPTPLQGDRRLIYEP